MAGGQWNTRYLALRQETEEALEKWWTLRKATAQHLTEELQRSGTRGNMQQAPEASSSSTFQAAPRRNPQCERDSRPDPLQDSTTPASADRPATPEGKRRKEGGAREAPQQDPFPSGGKGKR